jgi:hypothetical protein
MILGWTVEANVSMNRIQSYLQEEELFKHPPGDDEENPIRVLDANFEWGTSETKEKEEKETESLVDEPQEVVEDNSGKLLDINLNVRKGDLVIIVGT